MSVAKTLRVDEVGYVQLSQLWLTSSRTSLFVVPAFHFVGQNRRTNDRILAVKREPTGYALTMPKEGKINVTNVFPRAQAQYTTMIEIKSLVVPGESFRPAIVFYFARG